MVRPSSRYLFFVFGVISYASAFITTITHLNHNHQQNNNCGSIEIRSRSRAASTSSTRIHVAELHTDDSPSSSSVVESSSEDDADHPPRRKVLRTIGKAIVGTVTLSAFRKQVGPQVAIADVSEPTSGKIVTMEVTNLDGIRGKTGTVKIQVRPEWAPTGAKRFLTLTKAGFYNNCRVFRVLPGYLAQLGINGKPEIQTEWRSKSIPDDNIKVSNTRGTVVFANGGPNTRTTQIFFNTRPEGNRFLDHQGFAPFGHVIDGMDIVDKFYGGYGEGAPDGLGPNQAVLQARGDAYLASFPKLSFIKEARVA